MNAVTITQNLERAIIRLTLRGPITTRLLYGDGDVWTARAGLGASATDALLRRYLRPEQEPPGPDTRWRLIGQ